MHVGQNKQDARSIQWPLLVTLGITLAVFASTIGHTFVQYDDDDNIGRNPYLHPVTVGHVLAQWRRPYFAMYVPVTRSVWSLLAWIGGNGPAGGLNPCVFHAANVGVHLANVLLVYLLLRRLGCRDLAAGAGALLFGVHPLQAEPVAWATGMKDLLGGFFSLLALWSYSGYAQTAARHPDSPAASDARPLWRRYAIASACFVLALLAKPSAVALPLMAWAIDRWIIGRDTRAAVRSLALWAAICVPVALVARSSEADLGVRVVAPLWARPLLGCDALAFYLSKLICPARLGMDYGLTPGWWLHHLWGWLAWPAPVALAVVAWRVRRTLPWVTAGAGVFGAAILPNSGLVPFVFENYSLVADRYCYLALIGPAMILAFAVDRAAMPAIRRFAPALCAALLLFGALAAVQASSWRDARSLFTRALKVNPNSWMAHNNLGYMLVQAGDTSAAEAHYRVAIRLNPAYETPHNNLGAVLEHRGDLRGAEAEYRTAGRMDPGNPEVHFLIGRVLAAEGRLTESAEAFRQAVLLKRDYPAAITNLGAVLSMQGRADDALACFREAVRLDGRYADAQYNLGVALLGRRSSEASIHLRAALALDPARGQTRLALADAERLTATPRGTAR